MQNLDPVALLDDYARATERHVQYTAAVIYDKASYLAEKLTRLASNAKLVADGLKRVDDVSINSLGELQFEGTNLDRLCGVLYAHHEQANLVARIRRDVTPEGGAL